MGRPRPGAAQRGRGPVCARQGRLSGAAGVHPGPGAEAGVRHGAGEGRSGAGRGTGSLLGVLPCPNPTALTHAPRKLQADLTRPIPPTRQACESSAVAPRIPLGRTAPRVLSEELPTAPERPSVHFAASDLPGQGSPLACGLPCYRVRSRVESTRGRRRGPPRGWRHSPQQSAWASHPGGPVTPAALGS